MQPRYLIVGFGRTWWAQSSMSENQFALNNKMDSNVLGDKTDPRKRLYPNSFPTSNAFFRKALSSSAVENLRDLQHKPASTRRLMNGLAPCQQSRIAQIHSIRESKARALLSHSKAITTLPRACPSSR
jgi:hypothetical protein